MGVKFRYDEYILPNGRRVYLTNRPDRITDKSEVVNFIKEKNVKVRFQFTDDFVDFDGGVPYHWFIWVPLNNPPIENIYAFLETIKRLDSNLPIEESLWLHCDSSSMRAPTFFGLFLSAFYQDNLTNIIDNAYIDGKLKNTSRADDYLDVQFDRDPETLTLVEKFRISNEEACHWINYVWKRE